MTLHRPFSSVLIANRGEIAVRIVREAKAMGLRAIAVYSDADRRALWVDKADAAVYIGAAPPRDSYLNVERILAAAKQTNAEAIHPGYGFLSENPHFAQAVIDAGLVWIGPSHAAIRAMADKGNAKAIARKASVPVIPGYDGKNQSDANLLSEAKKIGWPVLIKAALGGGGRGQRRVTQEAEFANALASAKREALSAFASDRVILEKALDNVRHVEVQIFGDAHGNIIHLGERDCSIQRRNQKIIEEAPAPGMSEDLRARMGEAAIRLAKAVDYTNAGTVEYLLDRDGNFYFLEMNTRIQVEHPVTEEVTGLNLVRMQFHMALGEPLGPPLVRHATNDTGAGANRVTTMRKEYAAISLALAQGKEAVRLDGHAIEARLCAEDPAENFSPQSGRIEEIHVGNFARADAIAEGGSPTLGSGHYDSMLVKLIAHDETRDAARLKLLRELEAAQIVGIRTNRNYLIDLLERDAVVNGKVDIGWLEREPAYVENNLETPLGDIAALCLALGNGRTWRSTRIGRTLVILRERAHVRRFAVENDCIGAYRIDEVVRSKWNDAIRLEVESGGTRESVWVYQNNTHIHIHFRGRDALFQDITYAPAEPKGASGANVVRAPMAGRIVKVAAEPGANVAKNQILVILEAMKMEHELRAAVDGVVQSVSVKPGDQVSIRQTLVTLSPA